MKKTAENRYPHSATLFRFCKEALEIRYDGNVKVIDQDVGAILNYDPADCSHWKKGKKNIRALSVLRNIATHLSVDERLLIDIAGGKIGFDEAVFEFKGYGAFAFNAKGLDTLKKEYFKSPEKWTDSQGQKASFEELYDIDRPAIVNMVAEILKTANVIETPVYLPEVLQLYPSFKIQQDDTLTNSCQIDVEGDQTTLRFRGSETRPYLRFIIAKELFKHLCRTKTGASSKFHQAPAEVQDIRANLFAAMLLVPPSLLKKEVEDLNSSHDIISQLAESFWVSKAMMNQRLRDYMQNLT